MSKQDDVAKFINDNYDEVLIIIEANNAYRRRYYLLNMCTVLIVVGMWCVFIAAMIGLVRGVLWLIGS